MIMAKIITAHRPNSLKAALAALIALGNIVTLGTGATEAGDDPPATGIAPLAIVPKGNDATIETNSGKWESFLEKLDQQKIEKAKRLAPEGLVLPKARPKSPDLVEVWSKTDLKGLGAEAPDQSLHGRFGASLRLGDGLRLGVGSELIEDPSGRQEIDRADLIARVPVDRWMLLPRASIVDHAIQRSGSGIENANGTPELYGQTLDSQEASTRLELGHELRRPFRLEDGEILEPFANFATSFALDNAQAGQATSSPVDKVGVGVNFFKDDEYKLQATTDVDGLGGNKERNLKSRLQLTVPLD